MGTYFTFTALVAIAAIAVTGWTLSAAVSRTKPLAKRTAFIRIVLVWAVYFLSVLVGGALFL